MELKRTRPSLLGYVNRHASGASARALGPALAVLAIACSSPEESGSGAASSATTATTAVTTTTTAGTGGSGSGGGSGGAGGGGSGGSGGLAPCSEASLEPTATTAYSIASSWPKGLAVDMEGNVVIQAYGRQVNFGGGTIALHNGGDVILAKLRADGTHLWSKSFGDNEFQTSNSVATDTAGNIALTGYYEGTMDFGDGSPMTSVDIGENLGDMFLAVFDPAGNARWSKHYGDIAYQGGHAVAFDPEGDCVVTGSVDGDYDFGGGTLPAGGYLVKLDPDGKHIWSRTFAGAVGFGLAITPGGDIILTGFLKGRTDFGGGDVDPQNGNPDVFAARFDASGEHRWSRAFGTPGSDFTTSIALDSAGNTFISGTASAGTITLDGTELAGGDHESYLVSFDEAGALRWGHRYGSDGATGLTLTGVALDSSDGLLVSGMFEGNADLGGGPLTSQKVDMLAARFDDAGALIEARSFGTEADDGLVGVGTHGCVATMVGYFEGSADFGAGPVGAANNRSALLASFAP